MDRQRNAAVVTVHVSCITLVLLVVFFFMTSFLVMTTNLLVLPKCVVLLEGVYFTVAYYLRTLDGFGARVLVMGHICSIMTIYTDLKVVCVLTMTCLATFFPVYSIFTSICFVSRFVIRDARQLPEYIPPDIAECIHILIMLGFITYEYVFRFAHRTREDPPMIITVLLAALYIPNLSHPATCILASVAGLWIEYKSYRLAPLSEFPIRHLVSLRFNT